MRFYFLVLTVALAACATVPEGLPTPRYADAASRGAVAVLFAGRPSAAQVELATENWSNALGDSFACRLPMGEIIDAGFVGALEVSAMNAAADGGNKSELREGVRRYIGAVAALAVERRPQPAIERCQALTAWAPRIGEAGREAVARARRNGLIDNESGILSDLLGR